VGESSFWYRPTRVVPDQRPLNGRCCCCVRMYKIAVTVIVELHGWDMDIESTAGIAVAVCSATC